MTEEKIIERGCIHCSLCDEDEECYHKQLKRLEQENESLYQLYNFFVEKNTVSLIFEPSEGTCRKCFTIRSEYSIILLLSA